MITLHLQPIFQARGITKPFSFLTKAGFSNHAAHNLLAANVRNLNFDHMERLCRILICEPNDLFQFIPDQQHPLTTDHPLNNITKDTNTKDLHKTLSNLPLKKLMEITRQINTQ